VLKRLLQFHEATHTVAQLYGLYEAYKLYKGCLIEFYESLSIYEDVIQNNPQISPSFIPQHSTIIVHIENSQNLLQLSPF
jgi:hypothetical protein